MSPQPVVGGARWRGDERVVLWLPNWLGDCVMAEPVLAAAARAFEARLTCVAPAPFHALLRATVEAGSMGARAQADGEAAQNETSATSATPETPATAETAATHATGETGEAPATGETSGTPETGRAALGPETFHWVASGDEAALVSALRKADAVLLLRGAFGAAWKAWRAGVPRRIGYARDGRGWLLTEALAPARRTLAIRTRFDAGPTRVSWERPLARLAERLGWGKPGLLVRPFADDAWELAAAAGLPLGRARPRLRVLPAWRSGVTARLASAGWPAEAAFVLINVGGRPGSAKAYPRWAAVVEGVRAAGQRVVLVTGPGEEARLAEATPPGRGADAGLLAFSDPVADLGTLTALAERCAVALTADGGPRHVLAAAGARVVVAFGPTSPHHTAAHLERTRSLVGPAPCAPCHLELCPADPERACFHAIEPADLVAAALS